MNWDSIIANQGLIAEAVALQIEQPMSPIIADTVRDTITAMQSDKIKEFGGLEAIAETTIRVFDASGGFPSAPHPSPKSEPAEAPKPKRGKQ